MNLDEFVADTLLQIIKGVSTAQEGAKAIGARVNPRPLSDVGLRVTSDSGAPIHPIEFDVAVTTEKGSSGGAKVSVWGVGAGGELASKDITVSRIKFQIQVALPQG